MTEITLRPGLAFAGEKRPTQAEYEARPHEAHEQCFIASSITTDARCDALDVTGQAPTGA